MRCPSMALIRTVSSPVPSGLVPAMKLEGMVRYGLPYATANTAWDALRSNHPEFAERTDAELFEAFQQTGQGITSTFGDLW